MKKIIIAVIIASIITWLYFINCKTKNINTKDRIILNEQQLEAYLNIKGFKVNQISCDTVVIPLKFTGSYLKYAEEMKKSGFDLESHKGETVQRYTYSVDGDDNSDIRAELLLINDNELIGAAIIQQKPDGFIKSI